jgi:hypothetical protein
VKPVPDTVEDAARVVKDPVPPLIDPPLIAGVVMAAFVPSKSVEPVPLVAAAINVPPELVATAVALMRPVSTRLVPVSVVNVPAAGDVPPIAGGLARYAVNPAPDTVLEAVSVVNDPVEPLIVVPVIDPPVTATDEAACVDIVPNPVINDDGIEPALRVPTVTMLASPATGA